MLLSVHVSECKCQCREDEYRFQSYSLKNLCGAVARILIWSQCLCILNTFRSTSESQSDPQHISFHWAFFTVLLNSQMDWFTGCWLSPQNLSLFLLLDKSRGQRWSPIMVHSQTPCRVDPEACPFTSAPNVYPEVLQFLCSRDSSCSSASGGGRYQPVHHTCLVQHHW